MKSISNCDDTREMMPDLAAGLAEATPEIKAHLEASYHPGEGPAAK